MALNKEQALWVERLKSTGTEQQLAIQELQSLLLRGLQASMKNRYGGKIQVEDVVQEALVKILNSLDKFEGRSQFTTWAMTIATRVAIAEMRRKHFQDVSLDSMRSGDNLKIEVASETPSTENNVSREEMIRLLKQLIETELTDRQREAIQGALDGLPVEEIARRTQSNRNAVYKLIHDGRLRLRDGFANAGIIDDDIQALFA